MNKKIPVLITCDLEEFDIPLEYNAKSINQQTQYEISFNGMEKLSKLLEKYKVNSTIFTTANYAINFPEQVIKLSQNHEIASHSFSHSNFSEDDYIKSKEVLEGIIKKRIHGFRMPRLRKVDYNLLVSSGYNYDASLNPTWLPGRYNNLKSPITPFNKNGVNIIPSSVTQVFRIPLFWLTFKNLPLFLSKLLFRSIINNGLFVFYIHPWEFSDISNYKLPWYINLVNGDDLLNKFDLFLNYISEFSEFKTCKEYLNEK